MSTSSGNTIGLECSTRLERLVCRVALVPRDAGAQEARALCRRVRQAAVHGAHDERAEQLSAPPPVQDRPLLPQPRVQRRQVVLGVFFLQQPAATAAVTAASLGFIFQQQQQRLKVVAIHAPPSQLARRQHNANTRTRHIATQRLQPAVGLHRRLLAQLRPARRRLPELPSASRRQVRLARERAAQRVQDQRHHQVQERALREERLCALLVRQLGLVQGLPGPVRLARHGR